MKPINSLHYIYWIIILILTNIALFSYYYSGDDNLTSMIAFAATIASIILSVLAIFMSLLSNNSVGGMLHKVRDMHDAVILIPGTLNESISNLKETTSDLKILNTDVNKSLDTLGHKLQELEDHLTENDKKIQEIVDNITSTNSRGLVEIEAPSESLVIQYLNVMSLNGQILLYAFCLYKEEQKSGVFMIDEFAKRLQGVNAYYLQGIMVASTSANILNYTVVEGNILGVKDLSLSEYIKKERLHNLISKNCENIRNKFSGPADYYDVEVLVKKVKDYIDTL